MTYKSQILADYYLHDGHKIRTQLISINDSELNINMSTPVAKGTKITVEIKFPTSCNILSVIYGEVAGYEEILKNNLYHCYINYSSSSLSNETNANIKKHLSWNNPSTQSQIIKKYNNLHNFNKDIISTLNPQEHRKAERYSANVPANIYDEITFSIENSNIIDLSKGGMKAKVVNEYPPGYEVMVKIKLLENEVRVHAIIRWIKDLFNGEYQIGMQFHNVPEKDLLIIENYLNTIT